MSVLKRLGFFARRLHRSRAGQLAPLGVIAALPLAMLLAIVLNAGQQSGIKSRMQNAADAAAMTQATWAARSLNVMSMNNVAMTQTHAINVITVTMMPELLALTADSLTVLYGHIDEAFDVCPSVANLCLYAYAACYAICLGVYAVFIWHLFDTVILPLLDIFTDLRLNPIPFSLGSDLSVSFGAPGSLTQSNLTAYGDMAVALSQMNDYIVEDSRELAKEMMEEISDVNGIDSFDDDLLLYAVFAVEENGTKDPYQLPVDPVDFSEGLSGIGRELCKTGYFGTSVMDPTATLVGLDYNFFLHGYPSGLPAGSDAVGTGPYPLGRDSAAEALKQPREGLEHWLHERHRELEDAVDAARFYHEDEGGRLIEIAYPAACATRSVVTVSGNPFRTLSMYRARNPRGFQEYENLESRSRWSLLAFARWTDAQPIMMPGWFASDPRTVIGSSQAEIYNSVWYDLYTQDWNAKLTPLHALETSYLDDIITEISDYDEHLHRAYDDNRQILGDVVAH